MTDRRGDSRYSYMNSDYESYVEYKDSLFHDQSDLNTYLMLLYDDTYDYDIVIGDSRVLEDDTTKELLKNLGADPSRLLKDNNALKMKDGIIHYRHEELNDDTISIVVYHRGKIERATDTAEFCISDRIDLKSNAERKRESADY